jgi:hypothetical protein
MGMRVLEKRCKGRYMSLRATNSGLGIVHSVMIFLTKCYSGGSQIKNNEIGVRHGTRTWGGKVRRDT